MTVLCCLPLHNSTVNLFSLHSGHNCAKTVQTSVGNVRHLVSKWQMAVGIILEPLLALYNVNIKFRRHRFDRVLVKI